MSEKQPEVQDSKESEKERSQLSRRDLIIAGLATVAGMAVVQHAERPGTNPEQDSTDDDTWKNPDDLPTNKGEDRQEELSTAEAYALVMQEKELSESVAAFNPTADECNTSASLARNALNTAAAEGSSDLSRKYDNLADISRPIIAAADAYQRFFSHEAGFLDSAEALNKAEAEEHLKMLESDYAAIELATSTLRSSAESMQFIEEQIRHWKKA